MNRSPLQGFNTVIPAPSSFLPLVIPAKAGIHHRDSDDIYKSPVRATCSQHGATPRESAY
ncbi:MAG: hypothetical protein ACR2P4_01655 [Gammaproteobacteria bacterium]